MYLPIIFMFLITVLYASGLRNQSVRYLLLYLSLVYPAVMIFPFLVAIPQLNYFQLDREALHITILGVFHKHIYYSNIEKIGRTMVGNIESIGMMYKPSFNRYVFGRNTRRRLFGWDEILADAHRKDGRSLMQDFVQLSYRYRFSEDFYGPSRWKKK